MMSAVKVSLSNRNDIPLPATSLSTKQPCPGDDRSYTYISRIIPRPFAWGGSRAHSQLLHCDSTSTFASQAISGHQRLLIALYKIG